MGAAGAPILDSHSKGQRHGERRDRRSSSRPGHHRVRQRHAERRDRQLLTAARWKQGDDSDDLLMEHAQHRAVLHVEDLSYLHRGGRSAECGIEVGQPKIARNHGRSTVEGRNVHLRRAAGPCESGDIFIGRLPPPVHEVARGAVTQRSTLAQRSNG